MCLAEIDGKWVSYDSKEASAQPVARMSFSCGWHAEDSLVRDGAKRVLIGRLEKRRYGRLKLRMWLINAMNGLLWPSSREDEPRKAITEVRYTYRDSDFEPTKQPRGHFSWELLC